MRVIVFSAKPHDRQFLEAANGRDRHEFVYVESRLEPCTAALAQGADAVCCFVNDRVDAHVAERLAGQGVRLIALRCAGFNNVDLAATARFGLTVARVPAYSPEAVAEHAFALILALNRKIHRAYNRVREGNFALTGLLGFDLHGKTIGIVGVGQIGAAAARIAHGFGMTVLGMDPAAAPVAGVAIRYVSREKLLAESDIISLHCPLTDGTRHLIDHHAIARMKRGAMLINTSRGAVVDTRAVISGLKSGHLGALGIDVYEEEAALFFEDRSDQAVQDDLFARLLTFPNVIVTGHQGFFTREAMMAIAETTVANIDQFARTGRPLHPVETA